VHSSFYYDECALFLIATQFGSNSKAFDLHYEADSHARYKGSRNFDQAVAAAIANFLNGSETATSNILPNFLFTPIQSAETIGQELLTASINRRHVNEYRYISYIYLLF
jgi:hypothetical protein